MFDLHSSILTLLTHHIHLPSCSRKKLLSDHSLMLFTEFWIILTPDFGTVSEIVRLSANLAWSTPLGCRSFIINTKSSPADRCTEKHVYLRYRGTIPFWFYLVPLRLVSIFLNVGRVEISCGLLPTRFSTMLL